MRTPLDLDDEVLASAQEIVPRVGRTAGQMLSELARRALTQGGAPTTRASQAGLAFDGRLHAVRAGLLDEALFDAQQLLGHRQVTDAWLFGLAVAHGSRFVAFDARPPLRVARGATADPVLALQGRRMCTGSAGSRACGQPWGT